MNNIAYLLALHSIDGLGPVRLKSLISFFKDPKVAWEADAGEIRRIGLPQPTLDLFLETRKKLDPKLYLEEVNKSGIKFLSIFDENYPKSLSQIYDPPVILYYKGDILLSDEKAIAVVGTRKMTGYGKAVTENFVKDLVNGGLTIVSGLARGVDSCAHQKTLNEGGRTLAILGGGLNNIYPPENISMSKQIIEGHGAIISEFPPDYPSMPGNFPARNRIISGLSKGVLVTEAAQDSGSLITARLALEQGKDVFAVPGPITSTLSRGGIELIREGARIVVEAQEILDELGLGQAGEKIKIKSEELRPSEKLILGLLEQEEQHLDEISRNLNIPVGEVSASLLKMEIKGLVQNLGSGRYSACNFVVE